MRLLRILSGLLAKLWAALPPYPGWQPARAAAPDDCTERKVEDLRQTNLRLVRERRELQRQLLERPPRASHAADRDERARDTLDSVRALLRARFGWSVSRSGVPRAVAEVSRELTALKKKVGEETLRREGLLHSPGTPGADVGCGLERC